MDNVIPLGEHQKVTVNLSPPELTMIRQDLSDKVDVWPTDTPGRYELRAGAHVGFALLPGGRTLTIKPKVTIETLFALLAAVYDPARQVFRDESQPYTTVETLFEFVVRVFVAEVEDLIARGLLRGYRRVAEDVVSVRGRLLLTETMRHRPALRDRHWCAYSRFTPDVVENRILRWATFCLQPHCYCEKSLVGRLRRIGLVLAGVLLDPEARRLFERLEFHRLNDPYRPALALARLLLDHLTFSGMAGDEPFLAYLINMNWLFEKYVGVVLRRAASHWGVKLVEQDSRPLDTGRRVTVRPDVVLYRQGVPLLVIDAKYKLRAAQEDLYQMLAYCHALELSDAVLVHPADEETPTGYLAIRGPGDVRVHYQCLDLRGGPAELEAQGWKLARKVLETLSSHTPTIPIVTDAT